MTGSFRYRAAAASGQIVEGVLQAPSRQLVLAELQRQHLYPVAVDEMPGAAPERRSRRLGRRAAVALWTRSTATLLGAGVPLDRALGFGGAHLGHGGLEAVLREVRRDVRNGRALAEALGRHRQYFEPLYVATVSAGESTGALDAVFERLADHLEETGELRSQVRSALIYPVLMACVTVLGTAVLLGFVVPRFADIMADVGGELPFTVRLLMGASAVVTKGWWAWLALTAFTVLALRRALARQEILRPWHRRRLELPWIGELERKYLTARFARTLGLLLRSGLPMLQALRIARASASNLAFRDGVDRATAAVTEGGSVAASLAGTLPPLASQMLAVGEESGQLDALCLRVADAYDADVRRTLRTLVALVEPAMILVFGTLVGFVALAMLQAIYGINFNAF
ncbi:MAG TPA: type II secretion system F family protein [Gemmatimonadales bacterium]|nr:type II secretion system F family protein [Gemmatimonadales bacterium]